MRKCELFLAAITLMSVSASARIPDRIEHRHKERTNQRVDLKPNDKIYKGADSGPVVIEGICKEADKGEKTPMLMDHINMNSAEMIASEGYTFMTMGKGNETPSKIAEISH